MAISSADLIEPQGAIQKSMFPADNDAALETRVTAYITAASSNPRVAALVDDVQKDAATTAYSLYLAYDAVATRMASEPMKIQVQDQGSREFAIQQLREFQIKRDNALADFNTFTATAGTVEGVNRDTRATSNAYSW